MNRASPPSAPSPARALRRGALALALIATAACGGDAARGGVDATSAVDAGPADGIDATAGDDAHVTVALDVTAEADTAGAGDTTPDGAADVAPPSAEPLGDDRPAAVYLPDGYDAAEPWPLVFLLHGFTATGALQDAYLDFHARANAEGFIVVVPEGTENAAGQQFWDASPARCCGYGESVDDAGYLLSLIAEARERFHVEADGVYFFGHSNGGFMSYKMACEHADVVAGVVSLAGATVERAAECQPAHPVTVLQAHGTIDTVVPYGGSASLGFPGAEDVVDRWAVYDGCDDPPDVADEGVDYDVGVIGAETIVTRWGGCDDGVAVGLWTMHGSAHVPGVNEAFVRDALRFVRTHTRTVAP